MYKIERQGKFIVVNILDSNTYIPLLMFDGLPFFHTWAKGVAEQCKNLAQLAEEIEKVYKETFSEPEGWAWDYVKKLDTIDSIGVKDGKVDKRSD